VEISQRFPGNFQTAMAFRPSPVDSHRKSSASVLLKVLRAFNAYRAHDSFTDMGIPKARSLGTWKNYFLYVNFGISAD
jgi:hypothetical protein